MLIGNEFVSLPKFLDVEASSLNVKSYPIEVAWSDSKGVIESYLINPKWVDEWNDWDFHAQSIHGISRKHCLENGSLPAFVCNRLSQSILPGETVFADGGQFDQDWIDELYAVGSAIGYSKFRIIHSDVVLLPLLAKVEADHNKRRRIYEELKSVARCKIGIRNRHRASADVQYLIELFHLCLAY